MSELDPAELSALLDGELSPARGECVAALIAADPLLSAEFEALKLADQRLDALARASAFTPRISWPTAQTARSSGWLAPCLAIVVAAWASSRITPAMAITLGLNAVALALFVACLMSLAHQDGGAEPSLA